MVSRPPLPPPAGVPPPANSLTLSPAPDDLIVDAVETTPERIVVHGGFRDASRHDLTPSLVRVTLGRG